MRVMQLHVDVNEVTGEVYVVDPFGSRHLLSAGEQEPGTLCAFVMDSLHLTMSQTWKKVQARHSEPEDEEAVRAE